MIQGGLNGRRVTGEIHKVEQPISVVTLRDKRSLRLATAPQQSVPSLDTEARGGAEAQACPEVTGKALALAAPARIRKDPQGMCAQAVTPDHTYLHTFAHSHISHIPTLTHSHTHPCTRHTRIHQCLPARTHTRPGLSHIRTSHHQRYLHLNVPWCQANLQ